MAKFITKQIKTKKPMKSFNDIINNTPIETIASMVIENNENVVKEEKIMTTAEKIEAAKEVLKPSVKRIKKDKGLIERAESNKTILTEDNKELLRD